MKKTYGIIITTFILLSISFSIFYEYEIFSKKNKFLITDTTRLIFLEFENNSENNIFTLCKSNCDGLVRGNIKFVNLDGRNSVTFNDEIGGWIEIPGNNIKIKSDNGFSISFWVNVHTHDKRHNMIYNKGSVGWGSYYAKSINGLYEGDLRQFQALWTGNDSTQYLNITCDDGKEIELNKWYFVTHVLEKDQSTLHQYINGQERCNTRSTIPIKFETNDDLILGKVVGTYSDTSNMSLDNFAVYNSALNESEINEIFYKEMKN